MKNKFTVLALTGVMMFSAVQPVFAVFDRNVYDNKYKELASLIKECEQRGINVDEEKINAITIKRFTDGIVYDDELERGLAEEGYTMSLINGRSTANSTEKLDSLYTQAKESLESYLDGTKKSKSSTVEYKTGNMEISNNGIMVNGEPYYSIGYGHFEQAQNDIPLFNDFGVDNIQMEVGPDSILQVVNERAKTYTAKGTKRDSSVSYINKRIKEAEENNVALNLLLSPHYLSAVSWAMDWYDLKSVPVAMGYNIYDSNAKKLLSDYLEGLFEKLSDSKALTSIVLTNEPACKTYLYPEAFNNDYRVYLAKKYNKNIDELNSKWGTNYERFNDISMPEYDSTTKLPKVYDANFYDWYNFNDDKFTQWHKWFADEVRKYRPDIKISAKVLDYFWYNDNSNTFRSRSIVGNDVEKMSEFCDLAGCDAHGYVENTTEIISKYKWYDYLRSVTEQPIYNSEDHIFYDTYMNFTNNLQTKHAAADVWQGALHGREMSTYWTWRRLDYKKGSNGFESWKAAADSEIKTDYAASLLHRPLVVSAIGKQALNLRRFNDELRALEKDENKTAILYSKAARIYNLDYMLRVQEAYTEMISAGFGVDFVTDNAPEKMNKYDTVVIAGVKNIEENTLKKLSEFVQKGGKVILANSSLEKNEYNMTSDSAMREYIKTNSVSAESTNLKQALYDCDKRNVKLEIKQTQSKLMGWITEEKYVTNVDFKWVQNDDGSILINICNLDKTDKNNLTVYKDGVVVEGKDLINDTTIKLENFTAKSYEPILIYISGNGAYAENISLDKDNNITWKRGLFPVYVSEISDGIENKKFYALADNGIKAFDGDIYYLQRMDGNVAYPGKILSLQNGTLFEISDSENGYVIKNISDRYAGGIFVVEYTDSSKIMQSIYLAPDEEKTINASHGASARIYNNLSQKNCLN